jgi:hypothetical protein
VSSNFKIDSKCDKNTVGKRLLWNTERMIDGQLDVRAQGEEPAPQCFRVCCELLPRLL